MTELGIIYIRALQAEVSILRRHIAGQATEADIQAAAERSAAAGTALVRETHGDAAADPMTSSPLQYLTIAGPGGRTETMLIVTLYGGNRHPEVVQWHRRVMVEHFGWPVNYVQAPFPAVSHGACMNQILAQTADLPNPPDHYLWLDNDCVALRREAIALAYAAIKDRLSIWGQAWQSNHKAGPNGTVPHAYASQACLAFSRDVYNACGRPDMDHWVPRSDTSEELTYIAKAKGYNVALLYPSYSVLADTPLDNGCRYGMGNTYGPLSRPLWHHTSQAPNPRHVEVFVETCKLVMADAFEGNTPALPYGYAA